MPQRKGRAGGPTAESNRARHSTNETPNTPDIKESDIGRLKVDELRKQLSEHGVTGTSKLRKEELVKTLVKTLREDGGDRRGRSRAGSTSGNAGGGVREGAGSSRSIKYAQEITSADDEPERPGRSLVTTDHEVIRQWAERRDAVPATISGTEHDDRAGVLRFDFPGGASGGRLAQITWAEWFETFDERQLNFIYQEERADGRQSNFFRLESPDREDA